jgi:hypothetical protein
MSYGNIINPAEEKITPPIKKITNPAGQKVLPPTPRVQKEKDRNHFLCPWEV